MHLLADESIRIAKGASAVFAYAADLERFGEWFPGVLAIHAVDDLAVGTVGKRYRETVSIPLRGERDIEIRIVESTPGRGFASEGRFPPLLPRMEVSIAEAGADACTLRWRMWSRSHHPLARLWLPLARRTVRARARAGLARLKSRLERPVSGPSGRSD